MTNCPLNHVYSSKSMWWFARSSMDTPWQTVLSIMFTHLRACGGLLDRLWIRHDRLSSHHVYSSKSMWWIARSFVDTPWQTVLSIKFRAETVLQRRRSAGRPSFERQKEVKEEYVLVATRRVCKTIRIFLSHLIQWTIGVIQWTIGVIQWTIGVIQWTIGVIQWTIRIFVKLGTTETSTRYI
jgi:hypothetical protein